MAKFDGVVGFEVITESEPGIYLPAEIIERKYFGDVNRLNRRLQNSSESTNDNITISSEISIMADDFAISNIFNMKYVEYMGAKWKIDSVDPQPPRLILSLGGVYNG